MSGPRARLLQWALRQAARWQCVVAFVENPTMTQLTDLQRCLAQPRLDGPSAEQVATLTLARVGGSLAKLSPAGRWALLASALMTPQPSCAFEALRRSRVLALWLPEAEALFGVPQLSDSPVWVDVGTHQWRFIDETALAGAPLLVRFAALVHKLGKAGTPAQIWPHHPRHEERAHAALAALATHTAVPADTLAFAHLAIDECENLHHASELRAGPIAALLDRVQARERPERFTQLLQLCACDWAAFDGHHQGEYPKALIWRRALQASVAADVSGLDADAACEARALAVAKALGSRVRR